MELSLTDIATRKSRKATLRVAQRLIGMKESFSNLDIGPTEHYCLMATLIGESIDHFRTIPNSDGIYQVEVGYGHDLSFSLSPNDRTDNILLDATLDAVWRVIASYPNFEEAEFELISSWFKAWRRKLV